jgi:hypothetical protein
MRGLLLFEIVWLLLAGPLTASDWFIAGEVDGGVPEKRPVIFLRAGQELELFVVVEKAGHYFSDAPQFKLSGKIVCAQPLARAGKMGWREITPALQDYDNIRHPLAPVKYLTGTKIPGDVLSRRFTAAQAGTWYFTSTAEPSLPAYLKTAEPLMREYEGRVIQVVCRKDDSCLGYLTELLRTPFIMGPMVTRSGFHQTDQRVGSDCAEFAIYGQRRLGNLIPYGGPTGAKHYLTEIADGPFWPDGNGVYHNAKGEIVRTGRGGIQPGDILHFGQQVSVFYADRGTSGCLDGDDLCFQSWGKTPEIISIRHCGFYHLPLRGMRWNVKD